MRSRRFFIHAMRVSFVAHLFFIAIAAIVTADQTPTKDPALAAAALEQLLAERGTPQAFEKSVADARRVGVNEQALLEARFLYHVDRRDDGAIAAMLPDFLRQRDSFRPEDSAIFAFTEDFLAVVEYARALDALRKDDKPAFKKHITEAFWLSPGQAAAFAPHIEQLRLDDAMRDLKVDLSIELQALVKDAPAITPARLVEEKKALLFHLWSPWSRECAEAMDDFAITARMLSKQGIAVISLVAESPDELRQDARDAAGKLIADNTGAWAVDPASASLSRAFRVRTLPVMVLVSKDGNVLFNGEPSDPQLWKSLTAISPGITRPASPASEDPDGKR